MASVSLKLLLLVTAVFLLGDSSAQEFYDDEANLAEQYSPLLGENFIDYERNTGFPQEYGFPTVEEFPGEDMDDDDDVDEEDDPDETDQKAMKRDKNYQDNEHAQKTSSALTSKSDAREKRQLPLQADNPVLMARDKLQRAIKAAQALSSIENQLGLNPSTIENKTEKLEKQLKDEETNFKKLADQTENKDKKKNFVKLEKNADEDVNKAESILKLIVSLEAAKYLAKERAQEDLIKAQKDKIASTPQMILGSPLSYPPQAAGYFGRVSQPSYQPVMPSYTASYQPQMFQGISAPSMAPAPPVSLAGPANVVPPYQPSYHDNTDLLRLNAIKAQQASVAAFAPQSSAQHTVEPVEPETAKVASYSPEEDNADISPEDMEFSDTENPSQTTKPAVEQAPVSAPKEQSDAHGPSSNDHKSPKAHASATKPQPINKDAAQAASHPAQPIIPAQPVASVQPVAPAQPFTPVQPVAPVHPVTLPVQTIESAVGQSNGFMPQAAPLTASYNPGVAAPHLASMSRYFDSPSNSPNLFAPQSYYQPMPKLQTPQQKFVPHAQPKKPSPKGPGPVKPAVTPYTAFNDQPQVSTPPSPVNFQPPSSAAFSSEQALSGAYPPSPFYSWNTQALPSSNPQYSWNSPMYYPPAAPYQAPVNPLIAEAYRKLHDTERANLAMSKIEEAIGLSPTSVRHIVDDIEKQAKMETSRYEDDMSKEKAEITKEKEHLEKDEVADDVQARKKLQDDETKLRNNIKKENVAKLEVDKIKKIEKLLTIIEAAKYSAMQRANKRIHKLKTDDGTADGDDIRKRDLEDLENDIRRRRRNEINIWLKGSRNRINTSHFIRSHLARLGRHQKERNSRWSLDEKNLLHISENSADKLNQTDDDTKEKRLQKLKFFKTLSSNKKLDSGKQFLVGKKTDVPSKPETSANALVMAKMLDKMDKLFKIQGDILKYLKTEHIIHRLHGRKPFAKRWKRSLHHAKHQKKTDKDIKRKKRKAN